MSSHADGAGERHVSPRALARSAAVLTGLGGVIAAYVLVARGALTLDLGVGRRVRPLGPIVRMISAPPEVVFDVIAVPYLGRTPRAMQGKLRVLERGSDMVLAAHFNRVGFLTATTVETVRFQRPERIDFRVLRGPAPLILESYVLRATPEGTEFIYSGELGTDLWAIGSWWAARVAPIWEGAVVDSVDAICAESERRAGSMQRRGAYQQRQSPE